MPLTYIPWESLALLGVLALWGLIGLAPWCVALFATRGRDALTALPLSFLAGVAGGALVPALGGKGALGFSISLLAALAAGAVATALVARRAGRTTRKELS